MDGWRVLRAASRVSYSSLLHRHLLPTPLGSRPIVKVRPSEIQAWASSRTAVLSLQTLYHYTRVLRSMFASAVLDGVIAVNPVQPMGRLSLPKIDRPKIVPLTVAQVQAWADHAVNPQIRAMILTQAGLGLRIGELIALRVQDVDFLRREVHVSEQIDTATGRRAPLKTLGSRRTVPLPSVTAEVLAGHLRAHPPGPGGLIFTQAGVTKPRTVVEAGVWTRRRASHLYLAAAKAAGIPGGYTSHSLRHHYASVLLDAGESVHAVAERIGDRPAMVLRIYGHLMPDREDTTRRAIEAAWQAAGAVGDVPGTAGRT